MTSPFSVLVCTLCWELLYQTLGLFFQLAAPRLVLRSHSKGYSSMANHGHSYACALIHAVVVTARGLQHLAGLVGAPAEVQMMSPIFLPKLVQLAGKVACARLGSAWWRASMSHS